MPVPIDASMFATILPPLQPVVVEEDVEQPLVNAALQSPYSQEELQKEERRNGIRNLQMVFGMLGQGNQNNTLFNTLGMFA